MVKKVLFIINPISGIGRQKTIETLLPKVLDKNQISYDIIYTSYKRHAESIAKENAAKYSIIVAVGGDGTVNEVASGLYGSNCAMAVIPTGSGNGLARFLKIPLQLPKAIKLIQTGKSRMIDTVFCNDKLFVNVGGVGFDAEIGHRFAESKTRGLVTYAKITLNELKYFTARKFSLKVNDQICEENALLISFANSNQWGNNVKIAPLADITDGKVEICILRKIPIFKAPFVAIKLFSGAIHKSKYLKTISTDEIEITSDEIPLKYHIDGEPMICNDKKLHIVVKPKSLKIIVKQ